MLDDLDGEAHALQFVERQSPGHGVIQAVVAFHHFVGFLPREKFPRPVKRLRHDFLADFHLHRCARFLGLALQLLDDPAAGVVQPLHVAQAAGLQILDRFVRGIDAEGLVSGELLDRHAGLLGRLEQRHQAAPLLGDLDLLVRRQHAVEHAAHLVRQFDVQVLQFAVDVQHPGSEALEQTLHLDARGFTLEQIRLETAGELFVIAAAFLEIEVAPLSQVADTEPLQQRIRVVEQLLLAGCAPFQPDDPAGDVELRFEEEVAGFV